MEPTLGDNAAVRVLALIASHNEERFIGGCIEHLSRHGVETYLIDDGSTDRTVEIAEGYRGRGLIGLERRARDGIFRLRDILQRKEELASSLDADWFVHHDADEIRVSPRSDTTLGEALAEVDRQGYNAVNFIEFTYLPTREASDHDHPRFRDTMRWYYPFLPRPLHQVKAWKRQPRRVRLADSGGHLADFPGLAVYPVSFPMKHYQFLSAEHAIEKYVRRVYDPESLAMGWHGGRATLRPEDIVLPAQADLREYVDDAHLDPTDPWKTHWLFDQEVRR
jgi:glycosyltransferase involved in cell wall biosynthesis